MKRLLCVASASALLAACQTPAILAPDPGVVAPTYPNGLSLDVDNAADLDWRTVMIDARLQRLVELSLDSSRPLRLAVLDAEAAQAQLRVAKAGFWPQLGLTGDYTRGRLVGSSPTPGVAAPVSEQASVGIGLSSFELDLFGRVRAQSASAFASYLAAEEGVGAARIALIATVADAYVATLAAEEQLALVQVTLTDWRQSEILTRRLSEAGQSSGDEVAQAEAQVRSAEADLEAARRTRDVAVNALTLAVGQPLPADLPRGRLLAEGPVLTALPAGTPSDLLVRRPDIRQAERQLEAAHANVRAARAAFFPSISLTGQYGYGGGDLDDLFNEAGRIWSFAPRISVPIFQGGRLQGELDLAAIRTNSAVATYEQTIQRAFAEVADGLAGRATYDRQIEAQNAAVAANERRVALAEARFQAGVATRLDLLDAQRTLYAARQSLVQLRGAQASGSIALYRALGGGLEARPVT